MNERDEARKNRLAAALRENLKRRKQQIRGRAGASRPDVAARDPHPEQDVSVPAKDAGKESS
jgi:hypothetical protein